MNDLLFLVFIFLCAGVVAVPLAVRLGLGSVLGRYYRNPALCQIWRIADLEDAVVIQPLVSL